MTEILLDPLLILVAIVLYCIAVLVTRHARQERNTMGLLLLFVLLAGMAVLVASPAVVNRLVEKFEGRYAAAPDCASGYTALVVLGGGLDSRISSVGQIQYMKKPTMARAAEALRLLRLQDGLDYPVILAGGGRQGKTEAEVMREFLLLTQIPGDRLVVETESANTYANASNVAHIFDQREWTKKIRLVTSALHMYRASEVFKRFGFDVCPLGVDRQALKNVPRYALLPQTSVLLKTDKLWHEVTGILYYRLRGWM